MFPSELAGKLTGLATLSTDLFIGAKPKIPKGPGPFSNIAETGGPSNRLTQNDKQGYERPTATVVVRASSYSVARAKAKELRDRLLTVRNETIGGCFYLRITGRGNIYELPVDEDGRPRVAFNIDTWKHPS